MCAQLGVPGPLNGRWRHRLETRSATCVCVRPAVGGRKGFNLTSAKTFRLWANINPKQAKNQNRPRTGVKPIQTQPKPVLTRLSRLITPLQTLYHGSGAAAGGPVLLDKCNTRLDPPTPRTTLDTAVISVPSYIEIAAFRPLNKSCPHAADPMHTSQTRPPAVSQHPMCGDTDSRDKQIAVHRALPACCSDVWGIRPESR